MKKCIIFISVLLITLSVYSQSDDNDIIYPLGRGDVIKKCQIINISNGNVVDYQIGNKSYQIKALSVIRAGAHIDLLEFSNSKQKIKVSLDSLGNVLAKPKDEQANFLMYKLKYKKAVKGRSAGLITAFSGVALTAAGFLIRKTTPISPYQNNPNNLRTVALAMEFVGVLSFTVGLPILITNSIRADNNLKELKKIKPDFDPKLSLGLTNNGFGIVMEF